MMTTGDSRKKIELRCDDLDYAAIQQAIAFRQAMACLPDGTSDTAAAVLAEICRGWMELLGQRIGPFSDAEGETP